MELYKIEPKIGWKISNTSELPCIEYIEVRLIPVTYQYGVTIDDVYRERVQIDVREAVIKKLSAQIVDRYCDFRSVDLGDTLLFEVKLLEEKERFNLLKEIVDLKNLLSKESMYRARAENQLARIKKYGFWKIIKLAFTRKENRRW